MSEKILGIYDDIDRFATIDQVDELVEAYQNLITRFGFKVFCIGDVSAPTTRREGRIWAASWPEGWAKMFLEKNFASVDPIVHQMLVQHTGFRWRDVRKKVRGIEAQVMDSARDFSMNDGFGVPVHNSATGDVVGITMAGPEFDLSHREEASLHLATIYFEARLRELRASEINEKLLCVATLTTRERDCLSWVACGKTDWEIGRILNLGRDTITKHVQSATRKLAATNRPQAVALAIKDKQIHI